MVDYFTPRMERTEHITEESAQCKFAMKALGKGQFWAALVTVLLMVSRVCGQEKPFGRSGTMTYRGGKVPSYEIDVPTSFSHATALSKDEINWDNMFVKTPSERSTVPVLNLPQVLVAAQLRYGPLEDALADCIKRKREVFHEVRFSPVKWTTIGGQDWLSFRADGISDGVRAHSTTYIYSGPLGGYQIGVYSYPGAPGNDEISIREAERIPKTFRFRVDVESTSQDSVLALLGQAKPQVGHDVLASIANEMKLKGFRGVDWKRFFAKVPQLDNFTREALKTWLDPRSAVF